MGTEVTAIYVNPSTGNVVIVYEDGNAGILLVEPDKVDGIALDVFDGKGYREVYTA